MSIEEFAKDRVQIEKTIAFMKVASDHGDNAPQLIAKMTADILFRYFGKPARPATEASQS